MDDIIVTSELTGHPLFFAETKCQIEPTDFNNLAGHVAGG